MKYVLQCSNEDCEDKGKNFTPGKFRMKYDKTLKKIIPELCDKASGICPKCGKVMVFVEVPNDVPEFSVGTFKGLPDEKKKEILKQRFDKDVKRGSKDEIETRKKGAISKMIGYDKH